MIITKSQSRLWFDCSSIGCLVLENLYRKKVSLSWEMLNALLWRVLLFNLRINVFNRSPVSSLQIRYDPPSNSSLENLPPVASSIEQLLERQWSEGQQFLLEQGTPSDSKYSILVFKERWIDGWVDETTEGWIGAEVKFQE